MNRYSSSQLVDSFPQVSSANSVGTTDTVLGFTIIGLSLVFYCSVLIHRKHRAIALRNKIERLERLWQLNTKET